MRHVPTWCLILAGALALAMTAQAGTRDCCCAHCGRVGACQKVCRLVCEEKKVEIVCWGCKCEDFCVPGPSHPDCQCCEMVCVDCETPRKSDDVYVKPKKFVWNTWIPGCAELHTRKKLMKKTITKSIPIHKWVVEDLCPHCEANCPCASIPSGTELPPVPVTNAKIKVGVVAARPAETASPHQ